MYDKHTITKVTVYDLYHTDSDGVRRHCFRYRSEEDAKEYVRNTGGKFKDDNQRTLDECPRK